MKAIIVEDEFPAREELKYFIKNFSKIEILNEFDNGVEVLKFIQENIVDVIFLDINIPLLEGMLLARTINNFKFKPKIVFITAYKEHAVDAFELEAFDYILKPYSDDRIISMLNKLEKSYSSNISIDNKLEEEKKFVQKSKASSISLWKNDKLRVVNIKDIYYCEARERETKTHRSYIVNVSKINEIIPWFNNTYKLKLDDINSEIPVSRSKIKDFRIIMNI